MQLEERQVLGRLEGRGESAGQCLLPASTLDLQLRLVVDLLLICLLELLLDRADIDVASLRGPVWNLELEFRLLLVARR